MSMKSMIRVVLETVLPEPAMTQVRKYHYLRKIRSLKATEETDLSIAVKLLAPGDGAVDCGANFGLYTRFFGETVGSSGRVFSVEPIPSTFAVLSSNVRGLGLRHVTLFNKAVSDRPGQLTMSVPIQGGGRNFYQAHILRPGETVGPNDRAFTVEIAPLDQLIPADAGIRLMKVDVEGHELPCIRGAVQLLRRDQPALLIEVSGNPDTEGPARQLFEALGALGYSAFASEGMALRRREAGRSSVNYFFLKDNHVSHLRNVGVPVHG
jgi:FkbM family methyltransferase